ncbi:MAG: 4Fe-4S binding protein [Planctomycetes bacterium]|nr:4Fe-4S binding protein [Planctomycetota bacterium]
MSTLVLQTIRRGVQLGVCLGLFVLIFVNLYAHYRAARALEDLKGLQGQVLLSIDRFCDTLDDPQPLLDNLTGTLWSMKIGPVEFTDPLAAAEAIAASRAFHAPLLLSILLPVIGTLLLGRVFCSWICPGYLLFEIGNLLRRLLRLAEIQPGQLRFSYKNKYTLLGVGLVFATLTGLPLFANIYPPAVLSRIFHAWVFGTALKAIVITFGLMLLVEVIISPRWWCRTMCPGGALYGLIGAVRLVRVKVNTDACTQCRKCHTSCPMGLKPEQECRTMECDNCGVCLGHCPENALGFGLQVPGCSRKEQA